MLSSLESTLRAIEIVEKAKWSTIPQRVEFRSNLIPKEIQDHINNDTAGTETIATFINDEVSKIKGRTLEHSEWVDLKVAFLMIVGSGYPLTDNVEEYPALAELYATAFLC